MPKPAIYKQLKTKAHQLKPVVILGQNGYSQTVKNEIERALNDHELIKIKINEEDREIRKGLFLEISDFHQAEVIQKIGGILVIYRKNPDNKG